jgi:hypothetical protein
LLLSGLYAGYELNNKNIFINTKWRENMNKHLLLSGLLLLSTPVLADIGMPPGTSLSQPVEQKALSLGENAHHISAEACRECHQEIYAQWQGSMHANSTALKDPIHAAFYRSEVGDPLAEGEKHKASGQYPMCLKCHAPNAARDGKTKLDALPAYSEGVNCLTCHMMKSYKGVLPKEEGGKMKLGIDAYEMGDILQGPSGKVFSQTAIPTPPPGVDVATPSFHPFPMESNTALLRTADACLGCHERRNNPKGVPLCNTGEEFRQAGNFNCQQCHMPVNNGFADHSMGGGHDQAMIERGVIMTLRANKEGEQVRAEIELKNMLPHKMPTGAPFRNLFLKVTAYNQAGQPVWHNSVQHPIQDDPQAAFMLRVLDDEEKPAPPPQATKLGKDSRLAPGETRQLSYLVPVENVAMVRAELYYDLLLPALKQRFQEEIPADLKKPRLIARAEQVM